MRMLVDFIRPISFASLLLGAVLILISLMTSDSWVLFTLGAMFLAVGVFLHSLHKHGRSIDLSVPAKNHDADPSLKVLIKNSQFSSPDKYTRIQGVIDYINDLMKGLFTAEELDREFPEAQEVYFTDYYYCQVNNGGFNQYFLNSNFNQDMNRHVLNGLEHMKAFKNKAIFEEAMRLAPGAIDDLAYEKLEKLDSSFGRLDAEEPIMDLNWSYIATIKNLKVVADEDYEKELERSLATISDYEERKKRADEAWEKNKPRYIRASEVLCEKYGLHFLRVTVLDHGDDIVSNEQLMKNEEAGVMFYHLSTDKGYYYIIDDGQLLQLVQGDTNAVVGSLLSVELAPQAGI